eukprot:CAMPEP_0204344228 /NCGR_PEP_ID=MMETSP0469-20131031/25472_1 /ASSEMBLY_ACC=CAM_ASM_000384 /TAXON_ID=2969 /ORGANISM="Oxyrrhis marina" /LENGTH=179 /DNA_ID=CAMNT_0051329455 /DNA_START=87 /DNA_END=626 /DNA_ORIENTATION=-
MASAWHVITTTDSVDASTKIKEGIVSSKIADQVTEENIRSFYWWEGKVQDDPEIRLSFDASDKEKAVSTVTASHNYDVPMIIYPEATPTGYVMGVLANATPEVAEKLVSSRLVACAQLSGASLAIKTTQEASASVNAVALEASGAAPSWQPIGGNDAYLKWVREEVKLPHEQVAKPHGS